MKASQDRFWGAFFVFHQIYQMMKSYKVKKTASRVIPAKAGIQELRLLLDPGDPVPAKAGSRGDGLNDVLRSR